MMGGVFIAAGPQRSEEYDSVSSKYADFLEAEVLPVAEKTGNVKFTKDPDKPRDHRTELRLAGGIGRGVVSGMICFTG